MIRWGGLAGVFAAAMFAVSFIINQIAPVQRVYDSTSDYLHQVVVLMAYAGALVAVVGLHALQSKRALRAAGSCGLLANLHRLRDSVRGQCH